ncbi:MAG: class I SAM-dependent methyltransferase [Lachnospiraceae bacterium]
MDKKQENETLRYYEEHAAAFAADTLDVSFSDVQDRFLALLPKGGRILDFGCGAGRDTRAFLARGFLVDAIDGSPSLARIAQTNTGIPVQCLRFQELSSVNCYDGIWACASILHVPKDELPDVLFRMSRAAKPDGILYVSFKYGTFSDLRNGRYFTDLDEAGLSFLLQNRPELSLVSQWISRDARPGRGAERWLNALLRKAPSDS